MEFGKQHDTKDNVLLPVPTCYGLVMDLLRGSWCNRLWDNLLRWRC